MWYTQFCSTGSASLGLFDQQQDLKKPDRTNAGPNGGPVALFGQLGRQLCVTYKSFEVTGSFEKSWNTFLRPDLKPNDQNIPILRMLTQLHSKSYDALNLALLQRLFKFVQFGVRP